MTQEIKRSLSDPCKGSLQSDAFSRIQGSVALVERETSFLEVMHMPTTAVPAAQVQRPIRAFTGGLLQVAGLCLLRPSVLVVIRSAVTLCKGLLRSCLVSFVVPHRREREILTATSCTSQSVLCSVLPAHEPSGSALEQRGYGRLREWGTPSTQLWGSHQLC